MHSHIAGCIGRYIMQHLLAKLSCSRFCRRQQCAVLYSATFAGRCLRQWCALAFMALAVRSYGGGRPCKDQYGMLAGTPPRSPQMGRPIPPRHRPSSAPSTSYLPVPAASPSSSERYQTPCPSTVHDLIMIITVLLPGRKASRQKFAPALQCA